MIGGTSEDFRFGPSKYESRSRRNAARAATRGQPTLGILVGMLGEDLLQFRQRFEVLLSACRTF